jgi:hypothetical protein
MDQHELDPEYEPPAVQDVDVTEGPSSVAAGAITPPS